MQGILGWLADWIGIEVEPGTSLRLELAAWPEGGAALLILAAAGLGFAAVIALYRRDAHALSPTRRLALCALRCAALALVGLVLLEPNLVAVEREERPGEVILLLDTSQSMQRRDGFRGADSAPQRDAWHELGIDPTTTERLGLAKALLHFDGQRLVRGLAAHNRVLAYRFAAKAEALGAAPDDSAAIELATVAADGVCTDIGTAVRSVLEKSAQAEIAALVLLTDGRRNTGPAATEVGRLLARRKVPLFALGIGDPAETPSIDLLRIEAPDRVPRRDPFRVTAHVRVRSAEPIELSVRLLRVSAPGTDELVATRAVTVSGASQDVAVGFEQIVAEAVGPHTYRVEVAFSDAEPADAARQVAQVRIDVLDEQIRALLVAGGPSHEYQTLRSELTRDKTIDVACWLCSADPDFPQDGDTTIDALPETRAALEPFDVVILVDPDSAKLSSTFCAAVNAHVLEEGAGLWWVCGEKFSLDAFRDTASTKPLADLLPVVPDVIRADRRLVGFGHAFERAFRYRLTTEGRNPQNNLLVRIAERSEENEALWSRLPGYHFAFPVLRSKPAATPLVELVDPETGEVRRDQPLVALQFVGAGRALYCGSDETYRWRGAFEQAYDRYWVNGIRHLAEGRRDAGTGGQRLRMDEDEIELGQPAAVTVEARDAGRRPLVRDHVMLRVSGRGRDEEMRAIAIDGAPGEYRAVFTPAAPGFYTVSAPGAGGHGTATTFQVIPPARESEGPVDLDELRAIADASGGELCATPRELLARLADVPSRQAVDTIRTPHVLWDGWLTVLLLVSILGCEWWLRKASNLL